MTSLSTIHIVRDSKGSFALSVTTKNQKKIDLEGDLISTRKKSDLRACQWLPIYVNSWLIKLRFQCAHAGQIDKMNVCKRPIREGFRGEKKNQCSKKVLKTTHPHTHEVQKGINNNFDWRFGLVILLVYTMIKLHSDIYSFRKKNRRQVIFKIVVTTIVNNKETL